MFNPKETQLNNKPLIISELSQKIEVQTQRRNFFNLYQVFKTAYFDHFLLEFVIQVTMESIDIEVMDDSSLECLWNLEVKHSEGWRGTPILSENFGILHSKILKISVRFAGFLFQKP